MIQQSNLGLQWEFARNFVLKADYLHNFGTHFIIGRTIGVVNNPVVGGPDRVVNLESSVKSYYDGLLVSVEKRFADRYQFACRYTLSKALNYANDDQIPVFERADQPERSAARISARRLTISVIVSRLRGRSNCLSAFGFRRL